MPIIVTVTATDGTDQRTWEEQIDPSDESVQDRMEQAGGDILLAAALAQIHTYDIFPPRQDH